VFRRAFCKSAAGGFSLRCGFSRVWSGRSRGSRSGLSTPRRAACRRCR